MSNESDKFPDEKRMEQRFKTSVKVRITDEHGNSKICITKNLSSYGIAVYTEGMNLRIGSRVNMVIILSLGGSKNGIKKIIRKEGTVMHVTNGVTGFVMLSMPIFY